MAIHRVQRRTDVRDVLDEFEGWLLRKRSAQERTAGAYTARVAGFAERSAPGLVPLLFESRRMSTMPKKIDEELQARAVRLVNDHLAELSTCR
jgi:hypothetical protein